MPRPGIAYETVRDFIDEHVGDTGALPSIAAIVAACGGSATTITRFRRRYVEETQGVAHAVPDGLEASIAAGARALWNELVEALAVRERALDGTFEARMGETNERVETARAETLAAQHQARETRAALDESHAALTEERRSNANLLDRLTAAESTITQANGMAQALETRLAEREALLARTEREVEERLAAAHDAAVRLERQADARIVELEGAHRRAAEEHRERTTGLEREIVELQAALAHERRTVAQARQDNAESEARNATLRAQLTGREERIAALATESERSVHECRETRAALEQAVVELAGAKASIEGLERAAAAAGRNGEARERELKALRETNGGLVGALARLANE